MSEPSSLDSMAGIDLRSNYFELFAVPVGFDIQRASIQGRYLELQRMVHPDRFADQGERGQRLAVQSAAFVNEAYETLCNPVKRALYLLALANHPVDSDQRTVKDMDFLMEQMSLREALAEAPSSADPEQALEALQRRANTLMNDLQEQFVSGWHAGESGYEQAAGAVQKMQFVEKLLVEIEQAEEDFFDN